jgi:succinoglycan biosynthesis transport protein ExoP
MDESNTSTDDLDVRRLLKLLWNRKWLVLVCVLLTGGAAFGASKLQTPVYQATASLKVQQKATEDLFNPTGGGDSASQDRNVKTEIQVLESQPIEDIVVSKLGRDVPPVTGAQQEATNVMIVSVASTDRQLATEAANAYAAAYTTSRRQQAVKDLLEASEEVSAKVQEYQVQLDGIDADINRLTTQDAARLAKDPRAQPSPELAQLRAQRNNVASQQQVFKQKLDTLQVDSALKTGGAQLVEEAAPPDEPISPKPVRNTVLGILLGLVLGVGLVFLLDLLDDDLRGKEDVEAASGGLPVLGLIPNVDHWKDRTVALISDATRDERMAAEAYRALRTSVLFIGLDREMRSIQVTSSLQGEGKSTTTANLAITLAQAGTRVIAMCCDLRRPRLHEFFGLSNEKGFTSAVLGIEPLQNVIQEVPGTPNLKLVASGPVPTNPSELLLSERAGSIIRVLQGSCDVLLIDCPPVLPVTDAVAMSQRVEGTIVVVSAGETTRRELRRTVELLRQVKAPLLGTVVNGIFGDDSAYGRGDRYGYGYESEPAPTAEATPEPVGSSARLGRRQRNPSPPKAGDKSAPASS